MIKQKNKPKMNLNLLDSIESTSNIAINCFAAEISI